METSTVIAVTGSFLKFVGEVVADLKRQEVARINADLLNLKRTMLDEKFEEFKSALAAAVEQEKARAEQDLSSRGLANSTVVESSHSAIERRASTEFEGAARERNRAIEEIALMERRLNEQSRPWWKTIIRSRQRITVVASMGLLLLGILVYALWPTTYRYDQMKIQGNVYPARIHRRTGQTEVLFPTGWRDASGPEMWEKLPKSELAKLTSLLSIKDDYCTCDLYNGSDWVIKKICLRISITVPQGSQPIPDRCYDLVYPYEGGIKPRTSQKLHATLGLGIKYLSPSSDNEQPRGMPEADPIEVARSSLRSINALPPAPQVSKFSWALESAHGVKPAQNP